MRQNWETFHCSAVIAKAWLFVQIKASLTCFTHPCWWSFWIVFVSFEFAWKRDVCAIINPAKIGMILRLFMFPELNQMSNECSRIVLYPFCTSLHRFLLVIYQILCRNWRSEDSKDLIEDLEHILHVPWSIFDSLPPYHLGKRDSFLR